VEEGTKAIDGCRLEPIDEMEAGKPYVRPDGFRLSRNRAAMR
jgi:hypothetical protein